ncbi:conserved hypothetical protein [Kribbella flavida DSM 17836]|uniref:Lipoprotein n=1 Tax=Kribbella flavida (strain DSM 17836 / JCM 10339 / NBRC 14399) TaxID=479435 RepID=D2PLZ4_KRIFD|nr:hypothetical protein [Kribbella flavida]ADB32574.1 conserved hypothetical protein [Kribbella flavida DSM 17836]
MRSRTATVLPAFVRTLIPAVILAFVLGSCAGTVADSYEIEHEPAHLETVAGSDHPKILLEEAAVRRLSITTAPVRREANLLVVPGAAVFVDPQGSWWVYTNPEPNTYLRHAITIQRQADGLAYLTSGPPAGTQVATVGVPTLYGVEEEVGH